MREAGRLLERGLHPLVCIQGYQTALDVALGHLESVGETLEEDDSRLLAVAQTSMTGTSADTGDATLSSLVVQALQTVSSSENVDHEDVRMAKRTQGNIFDTRLVDGLILDAALTLDRLPRRLDGGSVLTLTCPLDHEEASRDTEIEVEKAEQWMAFIDAKDALLKQKAEAVLATGATAVFSAETIEPSIFHTLTDAGCFVLGGLERSGIEDIARASGASMCDHLDDADASMLGAFTSLEIETSEGLDGRRERLCLRFGSAAGLVTLDVGGGDGAAVEETIRGLYDALRSTSLAIKTQTVVRGGGSFHMGASLAVKEAAEGQAGRSVWPWKRSPVRLKTFHQRLHKTLAWTDSTRYLRFVLNTATAPQPLESMPRARLLRFNRRGFPEDHPPRLESATETACGLLRVDQVISARGD